MQINVETKPVASIAYNSRKKRLVETIERLYHRDAKAPLQKMISRVHPADMASILDELPPEHVVDIFYTIADTEMAAEVFQPVVAGLAYAGDDRVAGRKAGCRTATPGAGRPRRPRRRSAGGSARTQLMALLDRESKDEVESLLQYDPNSAGGIMTTEFFSLPHTPDRGTGDREHSQPRRCRDGLLSVSDR
jgi:magnesium transporter